MRDYKAGIYLRLSKEDDNKNNSIDAQREITTSYARKNGFSVVKEYVDNGWSGILDSRPALNEMILDILHKKINMLIIKITDITILIIILIILFSQIHLRVINNHAIKIHMVKTHIFEVLYLKKRHHFIINETLHYIFLLPSL